MADQYTPDQRVLEVLCASGVVGGSDDRVLRDLGEFLELQFVPGANIVDRVVQDYMGMATFPLMAYRTERKLSKWAIGTR